MIRPGSSIRLTKYIAAVAIVAAAVCVNILLTRYVARTVSPLLFAAALIASWQGGWGPGWLATILAAVADYYFFVPTTPAGDYGAAATLRLAIFFLVSTLISYLTSKRREAVEERDQLLVLERQARATAEDANAMKDRFLAVTSHELRSPLSAIMLSASLLSSQQLNVESRECVAVIQRSAEAQRRLIEDLLDVARLRTGKLRLEKERTDLCSVVEAAIGDSRPLIEAKNIRLSVSVDNSAEVAVLADRSRLLQVLMNLLGNAIKFTPEGGAISVSLEQTGSPAMARIIIKDTGRGIRASDVPHVFDQFWQVGNTKKIAGDGLGLGLAIARDLVKLHGGRIQAQSDGENQGAAFIVELPLAAANPVGSDSALYMHSDSQVDRRTSRASA